MSEQASHILIPFNYPMSEVVYEVTLSQLERWNGDKRKAADVLQISLKTIYNRLREMAEHPSYRERVLKVAALRPRRS